MSPEPSRGAVRIADGTQCHFGSDISEPENYRAIYSGLRHCSGRYRLAFLARIPGNYGKPRAGSARRGADLWWDHGRFDRQCDAVTCPWLLVQLLS